MRILSWNINGIRTLPQFHPWNRLKTGDAILDELKADIVCFQEMKIQRATLQKHIAVPSTYDSFFSFPVSKGGYSGVAVYTKKAVVAPLKAEEGLTGNLQPKLPFSDTERVSLKYPEIEDLTLYPDENEIVPKDLKVLDIEGRALVLDFGLFVLINVYCPAETSEERLPYKMNFHSMLQERVRILIEEGREVIVLGDINVAATPLDHCDGHLPSMQENFWRHPPRAWLRDWLTPSGPMIDVVRTAWPDRKGMYTCWDMRTFARASNYGSRVDYIFFTSGLLPWFKYGDIQPDIKGSDHCPIYVDLHEEITLSSGETLRLQDVMKLEDGRKMPPRISASFWDEFKQTSLANFFTAKPETLLISASSTPPSTLDQKKSPSSRPIDATPRLKSPALVPAEDSPILSDTALECQARSDDTRHRPLKASSSSSLQAQPYLKKTKRSPEESGPSTRKKHKVDQPKISTFFMKPATSSVSKKNGCSPTSSGEGLIDVNCEAGDVDTFVNGLTQVEEDHKLALSLSQESVSASTSIKTKNSSESKVAWGQLFAPIQTPRCIVHDEPCVQYAVNKAGPNKGKFFFICSRPVGPGYDKGRGVRLREEVDHQYRCNFFKWASEVKKEATSKKSS